MPVDFDPLHRPPDPLELLPPTVLDPTLLRQIQDIRRAFTLIFGSLNRWCVPVATFLHQKLALPRVAGYYHDPNRDHHNAKLEHCWNRTPDGNLFIDLTHNQFNPIAPEITIVRAAAQQVLVPDEKAANAMGLSTYVLPQLTIERLKKHLETLPH